MVQIIHLFQNSLEMPPYFTLSENQRLVKDWKLSKPSGSGEGFFRWGTTAAFKAFGNTLSLRDEFMCPSHPFGQHNNHPELESRGQATILTPNNPVYFLRLYKVKRIPNNWTDNNCSLLKADIKWMGAIILFGSLSSICFWQSWFEGGWDVAGCGCTFPLMKHKNNVSQD